MSKSSYIFDERTATYIPYKPNRKKKFLLFAPILLIILAGSIYLGTQIPDSKTASDVSSEKELLMVKNQYEQLEKELNYIENSLSEVQEKDANIYRTFFQMDTLSEDERKAGMGGSNKYSQFENYNLSDIIIGVSQKTDILREQIKVQEKSLEEIKKNASKKSQDFMHIPAIQPISNKNLTRLASGFGPRRHPILGISKMHEGIDFTAPRGTPIYASANGKVISAGGRGGYGNTVVIDHGNGYETLYAHMSRLNTSAGAKVTRGQVIGYVGSTGLSSGPHLHYEIKKDGVKINPISYFYGDLSPSEYDKLKEAAKLSETSWD